MDLPVNASRYYSTLRHSNNVKIDVVSVSEHDVYMLW